MSAARLHDFSGNFNCICFLPGNAPFGTSLCKLSENGVAIREAVKLVNCSVKSLDEINDPQRLADTLIAVTSLPSSSADLLGQALDKVVELTTSSGSDLEQEVKVKGKKLIVFV